jgi:hypothetical protein
MGLEPMTSPLPRECSTTELHQLITTNLTILPRTQAREHDAEGKKSKQNPSERPELPGLHGLPRQQAQHSDYGKRDHHASAAGGA